MRNILLIMTDQQRAGFTLRSGFALDTMPFVDGLAERGTTFPEAYTSYPACVPARTSLLTGRFATAHRVRQNSNAREAFFAEDLVDVLRTAGFGLHFSGKPHMHRGPADFDTFAGPYSHTGGPVACPSSEGDSVAGDAEANGAFDAWLDALDHGVGQAPTPFPLEQQLPYRIVADAMAAIDASPQDQSQFWWVSFPEPHNPYQVPEPYFDLFPPDEVPDRIAGPEAAMTKGGAYRWLRELTEAKRPGYDDEWRRYRSNYLGMLRLIDDQCRRLVEHLGDRLDDTVIIVLSDHGDYVGEYGLQRKGAGMAEALMKIPLVFSGSGVAGHAVRPELVSMVDVLPTICGLIGADLPVGVQGRDLSPLLAGEPGPQAEFDSIYAEQGFGGVRYTSDERPPLHFDYDGPTFDELNTVTHSGNLRMVRQGPFKLLMDDEGAGELYDLDDDPAELVNLFDDPGHRPAQDRLTRTLTRWMIRVSDDLPVGSYDLKAVPHNWRWAAADPTTGTGHPSLTTEDPAAMEAPS